MQRSRRHPEFGSPPGRVAGISTVGECQSLQARANTSTRPGGSTGAAMRS
jgi:hypothetical protein